MLEPWASLMALGHKHIETRSWRSDYRGDIAIHASASNKACRKYHEIDKMWRNAGLDIPEGWPMEPKDYPLGRVVAVGRLIDVSEMTVDNINRQSRMELAFGDWRPGRFAWIVASVRRVEQIPWKGALCLWKVPEELEARIAA